MKHFYFTKEVIRRSKKYGCLDILCRIYEIRKGVPYVIGAVQYNTASTPGATAEVFQKLMELGYIPKKYYHSSKTDWCGSGYFYGKVTEKYGIWGVVLMKIIKIKFVGIDSWNRPIYKDVNSKTYFGSTDALFGYDEEDLAQEYIKEHIEELTYFGQHFDCEPMGIPITNFKEPTKLEIAKE